MTKHWIVRKDTVDFFLTDIQMVSNTVYVLGSLLQEDAFKFESEYEARKTAIYANAIKEHEAFVIDEIDVSDKGKIAHVNPDVPLTRREGVSSNRWGGNTNDSSY